MTTAGLAAPSLTTHQQSSEPRSSASSRHSCRSTQKRCSCSSRSTGRDDDDDAIGRAARTRRRRPRGPTRSLQTPQVLPEKRRRRRSLSDAEAADGARGEVRSWAREARTRGRSAVAGVENACDAGGGRATFFERDSAPCEAATHLPAPPRSCRAPPPLPDSLQGSDTAPGGRRGRIWARPPASRQPSSAAARRAPCSRAACGDTATAGGYCSSHLRGRRRPRGRAQAGRSPSSGAPTRATPGSPPPPPPPPPAPPGPHGPTP